MPPYHPWSDYAEELSPRGAPGRDRFRLAGGGLRPLYAQLAAQLATQKATQQAAQLPPQQSYTAVCRSEVEVYFDPCEKGQNTSCPWSLFFVLALRGHLQRSAFLEVARPHAIGIPSEKKGVYTK